MGKITDTVKVLLIVNILFFVGSQFVPATQSLFALYYPQSPNFQIWQVLTHMFMHGSFFHILFNMYALYAFGSSLEVIWGRNRFLFFYFSAGLGSALLHTAVNHFQFQAGYDALLDMGANAANINEVLTAPRNTVKGEWLSFYDAFNTPAVGASGAIYGLLVAFAIYYSEAKLMLLFLPFPIKAKYFVPLMIAGDLFFGLSGSQTGVAHWAHIGGALVGFIIAWFWKKNSFNSTRIY